MAHVRLQPAESDASWGFFGAPAIDGQFTINNVPSGTYLAVAQARFDKGEEEFGEVPVVVADGDASVSIATRPPVTVRGRIVGAGGPLKDLGMAHVGASPLGPTQFFQGSAGRVREDGTFEFTVFAPRFRVRAWGTTGAVPWRQKEVRWRGELVDAGGLDGTGGDLDGVEVVVLVATARVQGTVSQLREGTVLLVPDEDPGEFGPPWHRAVLTDGRFVSPPLPPGRYIIGAAAAVSPGEITQDLIQALRAQGQALELGDREIRSVEISVIVGPR
jgi:hypothetical protein